jgi:hypothetical protein
MTAEPQLTVKSALVFSVYLCLRDGVYSQQKFLALAKTYFELLRDPNSRDETLKLLSRGPP